MVAVLMPWPSSRGRRWGRGGPARQDDAHVRLVDQPPLLGRQVVVHDQRVHGRQLAQERQRLPPDLRVVGHDDDFIAAPHHLPLGLDQQRVAVEQPLGVQAGHAQDRLLHVDVLHHLNGQRTQRHAGRRVDVAAEHDQVRLAAVGEQVGDRQAVGHDLNRPAHQQLGHL
jgi:hypothetical protein